MTTPRTDSPDPCADLELLLSWWQQVLNLRDWRVKLVFKHTWEFDNGALGRCSYEINRKCATIYLQDPLDASNQGEDSEETLVHELLHLHTAAFDNSSLGNLKKARRIGMEQMVDLLAVALVKLRREAEKSRLEGLHEGLGRSSEVITAAIAEIEQANLRRKKNL